MNSGPAPDPVALRRDRPQDQAGWRTLPAGGRTGATPKWPLQPDAIRRAMRTAAEGQLHMLEAELAEADTGRTRNSLRKKISAVKQHVTVLGLQLAEQDRSEKLLWRDLWKTPQAAAWIELGWTRDVAQYVRHKVLGEMGSLDDAKEARQWSDRLGLNPTSMLRNRWRVSVDEVTPRRSARAAAKKSATKRTSARGRLKVVPNAATE